MSKLNLVYKNTILAKGYKLGAQNEAFPILERKEIDNFLNNQVVEYSDKLILQVEKENNLSYNKLNYDSSNVLTYDTSVINRSTGSLQLKKSDSAILPKAKWLMNSTLNGSSVPDTSGYSHNGTAYKFAIGASDSYQFKRTRLNGGSVIHRIGNKHQYLDIWVYFTKFTEEGWIFDKYNAGTTTGFTMGIGVNRKLNFYLSYVDGVLKELDLESTETFNVNTWYHLALYFKDDGKVIIYRNKVALTLNGTDTVSDTYDLVAATAPFYVGHINGKVKDIYWDEDASQLTNVLDLLNFRYNNGVPGYSGIVIPQGIACYDMEKGGDPDIVYDTLFAKNFVDTEDVSDVNAMWDNVGEKLGTWCLNNTVNDDLQLHCNDVSVFQYAATQAWTIDFWIKTLDTRVNNVIITRPSDGASNGGMLIGMSSGKISFVLNKGVLRNYLYSGVTVNDGLWHHVAVTYDGSQVASGKHIYIDGVLSDGITSGPVTVYGMNTTNELVLGQLGNSNFAIDQLCLYDVAFSLLQIRYKYNFGSGTVNTMINHTPDNLWQIKTGVYDDAHVVPLTQDTLISPTYSGLSLIGNNLLLTPTNSHTLGSVNTSSAFSVTMWIYLTSYNTTGDTILFRKNGGEYQLSIDSLGHLRWHIEYGGLVKDIIYNGKLVALGRWSFITFQTQSFKCSLDTQDLSRSSETGTLTTFNITGLDFVYGPIYGLVGKIVTQNANMTPTDITTMYNNDVSGNLFATFNSGAIEFIYHVETFNQTCFNLDLLTGQIVSDAVIGNFNRLTEDMTFEVKFKMATTEYGTILTKYDHSLSKGFRISVLANGNIRFIMGNDLTHQLIVDATGTYNDNTWKQLFVTYNHTGGVVAFYVNGHTAEAQNIVTNTINNTIVNIDTLWIGESMTGLISNTCIYDKILTSGEIDERVLGQFGERYPVSSWKSVLVNDGNIPIQVLIKMNSIAFTETIPGANQNIKYAFIVHFGVTYAWHSGAWVVIPVNDVSQGSTSAELAGANWSQLKTLISGDIDWEFKILIGLYTTDQAVTPTQQLISINYGGYELLDETKVAINFVDDSGIVSTVKNISGLTITKCRLYTLTTGYIPE